MRATLFRCRRFEFLAVQELVSFQSEPGQLGWAPDDIAFNLYSQGNGCAASNLIPTPGQYAWGVLYDIPTDRLKGQRADAKTMAQIEGPRYEPTTITVRTLDGREVRATTFLVRKDAERNGLRTTKEYVAHIVAGQPHLFVVSA